MLLLIFIFILHSTHAGNVDQCDERQINHYINTDECRNEEDSDDEIAFIDDSQLNSAVDGYMGPYCTVTCIDPKTAGVHKIIGSADSRVIDDGNDDVELSLTITYVAPDGKTEKLVDYYNNAKDELDYGVVGYFAGSKPVGYLQDYYREGSVVDDNINIWNSASYYLWPLYFASKLIFESSAGITGGVVSATYYHYIDFHNACENTYLELYTCADAYGTSDNNRKCPYNDNTAIVDCIMHQDGEVTWIRSIDSEGKLRETW